MIGEFSFHKVCFKVIHQALKSLEFKYLASTFVENS